MAAIRGSAIPNPLPWWAWLVGIGLVLWAAGTALEGPLVLILLAALVYQFMGLIAPKQSS